MINSAGEKRMGAVMKKMFTLTTRTFSILAIMLLLAACSEKNDAVVVDKEVPLESVITLISNARIYTFDEGNTLFEPGAMAFDESGQILGIGDDQSMANMFSDARRIDLLGKTVLPGLIDSHGHLYGLALAFTRANLAGTGSKDEIIDRLRAFEGGLSEGEWLLGRGWDQNDWPDPQFPSRLELDAVFPDRPVWLGRIDGHAAWANSLAIAQADRDLSGSWQPEGGIIHRDAQGEPTGIFIDGVCRAGRA